MVKLRKELTLVQVLHDSNRYKDARLVTTHYNVVEQTPFMHQKYSEVFRSLICSLKLQRFVK